MPKTEANMCHEGHRNKELYNIIILKGFVTYIQYKYPHVDIDRILHYAQITRKQLNDSSFWFTQEQADRFYEIASRLTNNPDLAREAGKFSASSGSYSIIYGYLSGFINVQTMIQSAEYINKKVSRGAELTSRITGKNRVELITTPAEGVEEKPYQCENRLGLIEGIGLILTDREYHIEHVECMHHGSNCCRYQISWKEFPHNIWRRWRNWFSLFSIISILILFPLLSTTAVSITAMGLISATMFLTWHAEYLENKIYKKNMAGNSKTAEMLMEEIDSRHNSAILVQEIGQACIEILDIDELLRTSLDILQKRLDFNRGAVFLISPEDSHLIFHSGYGYDEDITRMLKKTKVSIDDGLGGPLICAIRKKTTQHINKIEEILPTLHERYHLAIKRLGVTSFVCAPIILESKTFGLLILERNTFPNQIKQSDVSLLSGIAQQIGICINNARSFQRLQESEERYRELVENANSIIMRIDTKGYITYFNEFAQKFFGCPEKEVLGQKIRHAMPMLHNMINKNIDSWLHGIHNNPEKFMNTQTKIILKDKRHVWIAWTNKPIRDDENNISGLLCIGNDVTELKRIEDEKLKLKQDLLRAQKMEALGNLAGGVAHDLNNILSSVVSYPDLMLMKLQKDSPLVRPLKNIRLAGEKAAAIVQDLLTMARSGVSITTVINLNDVLTSYLTSTEFEVLSSHHPGVKIITNFENSLMNSLGSEIHLSKSIMNLVTNAAEAMPKGGTITITTQNVYVDRPIHGYDQVVEGNYALLSITDTGIGIAQADIPHIFEPFYTKKVMGRSGTGLGMSVVWGTVKDHNGYIDIHSEIGKGTTIHIYLPVTRKTVIEQNEAVVWETLRGDESILVVDDILEQREIASELLSELGYNVATVSSGEEAVNYLKVNDVNIVLLDMVMDPGIDGLETYKRILNFKPNQKAIIVSGFSETDKVKKALHMGAGAYVKKPYVLDKIGRIIRAELDRPAA